MITVEVRNRFKGLDLASITSWQIGGETMETVSVRLYFFGSRITAEGDCSLEIKESHS